MTERESNKQRNFVIYPYELPLCRRMFCFETYDKRAGNYRMNYRKLMYRLKVKICNINRKSETVTDDNKFRIILYWWNNVRRVRTLLHSGLFTVKGGFNIIKRNIIHGDGLITSVDYKRQMVIIKIAYFGTRSFRPLKGYTQNP